MDAFSTEFALGRGGDDVMAVTIMAATMAPRLVAPLLCLVLLGPYAAAWDRATDGYRRTPHVYAPAATAPPPPPFPPPADATLAALTVSAGHLMPTFAAGTHAYTVDEVARTKSVTVTATASNSSASLLVQGASVKSGSPSAAISLDPTQPTLVNVTVTNSYINTTRAQRMNMSISYIVAISVAWDKPVEDYRSMLIAFSKDVPQWTAKTRALREWMAAHDPDCEPAPRCFAPPPCAPPLLAVLLPSTHTRAAPVQRTHAAIRAHARADPLYHLAAPEGWNNDPNGVTFDPKDGGLYHRFYQYDKTYGDQCMHGDTKACNFNGKAVPNPQARVWGHTVSRDGATWEDWPGARLKACP
jgi:hypothetical protein